MPSSPGGIFLYLIDYRTVTIARDRVIRKPELDDLELSPEVRPGNEGAWRIFLSLPPQHWHSKQEPPWSELHLRDEHLTSGLQACAASILPREPSPRPLSIILFKEPFFDAGARRQEAGPARDHS